MNTVQPPNTSNITTVPDNFDMNNIYNANMPNRGNVNMMNNNHVLYANAI